MTSETDDYKSWKTEIDEAIITVCIRIIQEPLLYFSEDDVQVMLVEALRKIKPIEKLYDTKVYRGEGSEGVYKTSLVHREYGAEEGRRLDIVILDPNEVRKIDNVNLMKTKTDYFEPAYAFELGTEKTADAAAHFKKDIDKLTERTKQDGCGYLIHLYKDSTRARSGTLSHEKTNEKIDDDFKKVFEGQVIGLPSNIKVLAILLRTGKKQERMLGKCEIFNGKDWPRDNIGRELDIRTALQEQLK